MNLKKSQTPNYIFFKKYFESDLRIFFFNKADKLDKIRSKYLCIRNENLTKDILT